MDRDTHIFSSFIVALMIFVGDGSTFAQDRLWQPYLEMEGRDLPPYNGTSVW